VKKISLIRVENTATHTLGCILVNDRYVCMSMENPWQDNKPNVSCVPTGLYEVGYDISPKYGLSLKVKDVPDRTHILFHAGNTAEDTRGCILPGQGVSFFGDRRAVTSSRNALSLLTSLLPDDELLLLEVINK